MLAARQGSKHKRAQVRFIVETGIENEQTLDRRLRLPALFVVCELGPITFEGPRWQDYLMNPFLLSL